MKVGKFIIILFCILSSCSVVSKQTTYYIKNQKCDFIVKKKNDDLPPEKCNGGFVLKLKTNYISIDFPSGNFDSGLGDGYYITWWLILIPIKTNYPKFENNTERFYISLSNIDYDVRKPNYKEQNQYFVDFKENAKIILIVDNKEYKSNIIYNYPNILYLSFPPLKIKDVKKGTIIIEYKDIKEEVDFELGFEKHVVPN